MQSRLARQVGILSQSWNTSGQAHGPIGARIALELIDEFVLFQHVDAWGKYDRAQWTDVAELEDLFKSEALDPSHGRFIDQRYIDYLHRNFEDIDHINWRKFEALTGEYFDREGFHVELGPGRNDDGIDARIWPKKEDAAGPPTVLVQCKRQKEKIQKVVVKALWADVVEERAKSGPVVTTSKLSPGAQQLAVARGYPVGTADRDSLKKWIQAMRSPGAGVFLGE